MEPDHEEKFRGWLNRWGKDKIGGAVPVASPTLDPRFTRLEAPWEAVNAAARQAYSVNTYENVTEFTGIILHVAPYNTLGSPNEDPLMSETPLAAAVSSMKKFTLKCYVIDGPQTAFQTVPPNFSQIKPDTDLDKLFRSYPEFIYEMSRNSTIDVLPCVGDLVKLKFNNSQYTKGICVKHLRRNNFEILYSLDAEKSKVDQFENASNTSTTNDFSDEPLPRESPPKWNKPCLNANDPKFAASSLRTSPNMKKLIKSWEERSDIPYNYDKPKGWRTGLSSYNDSTKVPAIGWGHLIKTSEHSKYPVKVPISSVQAQRLFNEDLRLKEKRLGKIIKVPVTQNQFDAIMSFYFDMGIALLRGKASIIGELNAGNCAGAAKAFLQFGPHSRGSRKEIFIKRRKYEASLFVSSQRRPSIVPPETRLNARARAAKRSENFGVESPGRGEMLFWKNKGGD